LLKKLRKARFVFTVKLEIYFNGMILGEHLTEIDPIVRAAVIVFVPDAAVFRSVSVQFPIIFRGKLPQSINKIFPSGLPAAISKCNLLCVPEEKFDLLIPIGRLRYVSHSRDKII